jgi:hypothetical protein
VTTRYDLDSVKDQIVVSTESTPDSFRNAENVAEAEAIELAARQQFLTLRGAWSKWLVRWIGGLLAFQILLTVAVGLNLLDFQKYQWFLPLVITENFGQIIAMGLIIVRFLYPQSRTEKPPTKGH